jgi:hypothetical protein
LGALAHLLPTVEIDYRGGKDVVYYILAICLKITLSQKNFNYFCEIYGDFKMRTFLLLFTTLSIFCTATVAQTASNNNKNDIHSTYLTGTVEGSRTDVVYSLHKKGGPFTLHSGKTNVRGYVTTQGKSTKITASIDGKKYNISLKDNNDISISK